MSNFNDVIVSNNNDQYLIIANISKKNNIKELLFSSMVYKFIPIIVRARNIDIDAIIYDIVKKIKINCCNLENINQESIELEVEEKAEIIIDYKIDDEIVIHVDLNYKDDYKDEINNIKNNILFFDNLTEVNTFLNDKNVPIIGIEIMKESYDICNYNYSSSIAVMPGNEGSGLNTAQKNVCSDFIYIPQYGCGTASLNVNTATCVILHRYYLSQL
jgi:hypothetical protein